MRSRDKYQRDPRFRAAERKYHELRYLRETGRLTEEEFADQVRKLELRDSKGRFWSIRGETGDWFVQDGSGWTRSRPPAALAPYVRVTLPPRTGDLNLFHSRRRRTSSLLGLFLIVGLGLVCGATMSWATMAFSFPVPHVQIPLSFVQNWGVGLGAPTVGVPVRPTSSEINAVQAYLPPPSAPSSPTMPSATPVPTTRSAPAPTILESQTTSPTLEAADTPVPPPQPIISLSLTRVPPTVLPTDKPPLTATVSVTPDQFSVSSIRWAPAEPLPGETVTFYVTFQNTFPWDQIVLWKLSLFPGNNPAAKNASWVSQLQTNQVRVGLTEAPTNGYHYTESGERICFIARVTRQTEGGDVTVPEGPGQNTTVCFGR